MMDNDYFELSLAEKKDLKNEISYDLKQLVINICSQWDDMSASVDYNEFGSLVQKYLENAIKNINCPRLCAYAWNADDAE
jgi:putative IMPACT (imprinted ancient) family translation regulator